MSTSVRISDKALREIRKEARKEARTIKATIDKIVELFLSIGHNSLPN